MRLLKVPSAELVWSETYQLELVEHIGNELPSYAVLSHTWGEDELLYEDIRHGSFAQRKAFSKVKSAVKNARIDGFDYLWIDTCCIDKSSSAELQEAINSMFAWYKRASICYAHLADVAISGDSVDFQASRWVRRGWTLQELLAPRATAFFDMNWSFIGRLQKHVSSDLPDEAGWPARHLFYRPTQEPLFPLIAMENLVSAATKIPVEYLNGAEKIHAASIATRMYWASGRQTTREEDKAYCLMGLFDVNMPLLYGEGPKAFLRLQEEIMKQSDDTSLFAWESTPGMFGSHGLLADSPAMFTRPLLTREMNDADEEQSPFLMTNKGIQIELPLQHFLFDVYLGILNCGYETGSTRLAVYLLRTKSKSRFRRIFCDRLAVIPTGSKADLASFFVQQSISRSKGLEMLSTMTHHAFHLRVTGSAADQWQVCKAVRQYQWWHFDKESRKILNMAFNGEDFYCQLGQPSIALIVEHMTSGEQTVLMCGLYGEVILGLDVRPAHDLPGFSEDVPIYAALRCLRDHFTPSFLGDQHRVFVGAREYTFSLHIKDTDSSDTQGQLSHGSSSTTRLESGLIVPTSSGLELIIDELTASNPFPFQISDSSFSLDSLPIIKLQRKATSLDPHYVSKLEVDFDDSCSEASQAHEASQASLSDTEDVSHNTPNLSVVVVSPPA